MTTPAVRAAYVDRVAARLREAALFLRRPPTPELGATPAAAAAPGAATTGGALPARTQIVSSLSAAHDGGGDASVPRDASVHF